MFPSSLLSVARLFGLMLCLGVLPSGPAFAHSLKVFATVEGDQVRGYGFYVGGGRPHGVRWTATMDGKVVTDGTTDADGAFAFPAPDQITAPLIVTINSGDGHVASKQLAAERFAGAVVVSPQDPAATEATAGSPAQPIAPHTASTAPTSNGLTEAQIRTAVAREITPLLERIEEMDARVRLADIIAGICMIFGLAGLTLWVKAKRSAD